MNTSRRSRHRSQPAVPEAEKARLALRALQLERAIRQWLGGPPGDRQLDHLARTTASAWLRESGDRPLVERLPTLLEGLGRLLPQSQATPAADFDRAFAGALMRHALDEVSREAERSGRMAAFERLRPHLQADPDARTLEQVAQALGLSPKGAELALVSLRRRLRGRIEAALDLWADGPESRDTLRRHMRAAFTEPSP
jgi:hypothetical protein